MRSQQVVLCILINFEINLRNSRTTSYQLWHRLHQFRYIFLMIATKHLHRACTWAALKSCFFSTSGSKTPVQFLSPDPQANNHELSDFGMASSNNVQRTQASPEKLILSDIAQKAVWASKIVQKICSSHPPTSIDSSLRDNLIKLQINTASYGFDLNKQNRAEVLQMFTTGIKIDTLVFNQPRVTMTISKEHKIVFFPTNTVSKLVFDILMNRKNYIFVGSYGIGKTFSYIMFIYLTRYINHLRYLAYSQWIPQQARQKYLKQVQMLEKLNLLENVPKVWYWSIDMQLTQGESTVIKLIEKQTTELCLTQEIKKKLLESSNLEGMISYLQSIHPQQIYKVITIDQINYVASYMRNWNAVSPGKRKIKWYTQNYKNPAQKIKSLIKSYMKLGLYFIFNSSLQIEKNLLAKSKNKHTLDLAFSHGKPYFQKIQYSNQLKLSEIEIQFLQFFLFLFELYCVRVDAKQVNFKQLKQKFHQGSIKIKPHYRPLFLRQYIDKYLLKNPHYAKSLGKQMSNQQIEQFILEIKNSFDKFCLTESNERLTQFISKEPVQFKRALVRIFLIEAFACKKKGNQKLVVRSGSVQRIVEQNAVILGITQKTPISSILQLYLKSNDHNHELLPCIYDKQNGTIELDWTPQEFIDIAFPFFYQIITFKQRQTKIPQPIQALLQTRSNFAGIAGEGYLLYLVMESSGVQFKCMSQITQKKEPVFITKQFEINGIEAFLAFNVDFVMNKDKNSQKSKVSLSHNLEKILAKAKLHPNQTFVGTPIMILENKDGKKTQKYADQSECVDFLFVKYVAEEQTFDITTFDITIQQRTKTKVDNAVNLLAKLLIKVPTSSQNQKLIQASKDRKKEQIAESQQTKKKKYKITNDIDKADMNKYRIDHVIVGFYSQTPQVIADNLFSISYYSMEGVSFRNLTKNDYLKQYEECLRLIKNI